VGRGIGSRHAAPRRPRARSIRTTTSPQSTRATDDTLQALRRSEVQAYSEASPVDPLRLRTSAVVPLRAQWTRFGSARGASPHSPMRAAQADQDQTTAGAPGEGRTRQGSVRANPGLSANKPEDADASQTNAYDRRRGLSAAWKRGPLTGSHASRRYFIRPEGPMPPTTATTLLVEIARQVHRFRTGAAIVPRRRPLNRLEYDRKRARGSPEDVQD